MFKNQTNKTHAHTKLVKGEILEQNITFISNVNFIFLKTKLSNYYHYQI